MNYVNNLGVRDCFFELLNFILLLLIAVISILKIIKPPLFLFINFDLIT